MSAINPRVPIRGMRITQILLERFVERVIIAGSLLHSRAFRNTIDPLQQMWERLHVLLREAAKFPSFHPRPSPNISDRILTFACSSKVVSRFPSVLS